MAGVESPLVCDILSYADPETGLMPEGFMDSIGNRLKIYEHSYSTMKLSFSLM